LHRRQALTPAFVQNRVRQQGVELQGKGKILVVDDDRLVLATLTHGLAQAGYDVIDADNGDDAILLAREHKPDLALLDIRMEGKSGFDVAAYLREYCQMPFMFLSAFSDDATVKQVKALGAVAYLVKPLDIRQIVPAVEAAFANADARKGLAEAAPSVPRGDKPAAGSAAMAPEVAMAVGVLMHRYSLARGPALERLHRMAVAEGFAIAEQAERLLSAVELLSMPAAG
jgi:DNA-binding response OmpR family regulator